jgi:hypothetical protein
MVPEAHIAANRCGYTIATFAHPMRAETVVLHGR